MSKSLLPFFLLVLHVHYILVDETKPLRKECPTPSKGINVSRSTEKEQNSTNCTREADVKDDTTSSNVLPDIAIITGIAIGIVIILKLRSSISYHCSSLKETIVEFLYRGELTDEDRMKQRDNEGQEKSAYDKTKRNDTPSSEPEKTKTQN